MDDLGRYVDNIEGITFGPTLPNGHRTLIFVADNNFSPLQKTQLLLFEVTAVGNSFVIGVWKNPTKKERQPWKKQA